MPVCRTSGVSTALKRDGIWLASAGSGSGPGFWVARGVLKVGSRIC